ncbi:hypothetical protein [Acrocarpospora pleiomorpha]|nr:hypothetical protein [Acrocarpospora pleiomorpha]
MSTEPKIIRTRAELRALRPRQARRGIRRIALEFPDDPNRHRKAEDTINHSLRACGCETAAAFVAVGLLGIAVSLLHDPAPLDVASVWAWPRIFVLLALLALAGKTLGLVIAEWRLRTAIDRIGQEETRP